MLWVKHRWILKQYFSKQPASRTYSWPLYSNCNRGWKNISDPQRCPSQLPFSLIQRSRFWSVCLLPSLVDIRGIPDPVLFLMGIMMTWQRDFHLSRCGQGRARHSKKERRWFSGDNKVAAVTGSGGSGLFCPSQIPETKAGCCCPCWDSSQGIGVCRGRRQFGFVCASELTKFSFANAAVKLSVRSVLKPHKDVDVKNACKTEEGRKRKHEYKPSAGKAGRQWGGFYFVLWPWNKMKGKEPNRVAYIRS